MLQISYVSRSAQPMSSAQLLDLLVECRRNNEEIGVTGMLLYGNGTFLQAIEGDDDVIEKLVERITGDARHAEIQMLSRKSIPEREYAQWSMGFEQISGEDFNETEGLANFTPSDFTFEYLSGHGPVVDRLLQHYRDPPHWDQVIGEMEAKDRVIRHLESALNQARDHTQIARLALQGITEAARAGDTSDSLLQLCESTLASMRRRPPD